MLDGTLTTPEERARAARVIDAESRRVLHLVGELLDLSRIESGQQRMEMAGMRVDELLAHVSDVFTLRAEDAGISLEVRDEGSAAPVVVRADFDRIEQVLGNLLDNAFRHTQRGGRVELGTRDAGEFVELYVADDGQGIDPGDLPHVFDRFYRSQLGEPEMPSAGLGLAISREIVRAHGGAIRASARPGAGAELAFTLRRDDTPSAEQNPASRPAQSAGTSPSPQT
jgi:signal transduction histidine kinase